MTEGRGAAHAARRRDSRPRQDSARFRRTLRDNAQFKTYELFIRGSFHLVFSDHGLTETTENEMMGNGGLLYICKNKVAIWGDGG